MGLLVGIVGVIIFIIGMVIVDSIKRRANKSAAGTRAFYEKCCDNGVRSLYSPYNIDKAFKIAEDYKWPKEIKPYVLRQRFDGEKGDTKKTVQASYNIKKLYSLFVDGENNQNTKPSKIKIIQDLPDQVTKAYDIFVNNKCSELKKNYQDLINKQYRQAAINHQNNSQPKDASVVGRAAAGAVIAGPAGAVVGALSAVDKNNRNKK